MGTTAPPPRHPGFSQAPPSSQLARPLSIYLSVTCSLCASVRRGRLFHSPRGPCTQAGWADPPCCPGELGLGQGWLWTRRKGLWGLRLRGRAPAQGQALWPPSSHHAGRGPASGPSSRGCYWGPCCQLPALCPQGTQEAWPKRQVGPGGTPRYLGAGKGGMCGTGTPLSMCPALPALASLGAGPRPARHSRHSGPGARWPRHPGPALRADRVGRWVSSHPSPGSFGTRQDGGAPSRGEGLYARGTATGREKPTPPLGGGQPAGCWAGPVTKNGSFPPGPHFLSGTLRL